METLVDGAERLNLRLTPEQIRLFQTYYDELVADAGRSGLTAIIDYEGIQRRHFLESLALLVSLERVGALGPAIDIGSGAGLPGLPVKILRPALTLTLLEASRKKSDFLERLIRRLELSDVRVIRGRAEELGHDPAHRQAYDLVLARAVAPLPTLVELALPFLRSGGWLAAPKGSRASREADAASKALALCGGRVEHVERMGVPGVDVSPTLVLVRKVAPTPDRFPRRTGIPRKRPLR